MGKKTPVDAPPPGFDCIVHVPELTRFVQTNSSDSAVRDVVDMMHARMDRGEPLVQSDDERGQFESSLSKTITVLVPDDPFKNIISRTLNSFGLEKRGASPQAIANLASQMEKAFATHPPKRLLG